MLEPAVRDGRKGATQKADPSLPHSLEAEKAVLGGVLTDSDSLLRIEGMLRVEHFLFEPHQKIYAAILDLSAKSESADILTVADKLRSERSDLLSPAYLVELTENCPVTQNIEFYAKIVRTDYYRRRVILACHESIRNATHFHGTIESYIEKVEKEFLAIASEHDRKGIQAGRAVLDATIEDIERRLANPEPITGVPSGFTELDLVSGGWQQSDLVILAARPGMGKTAFILNCATYAAKAKKHVVFFTLEMSKEQLMSRIISTEARVDSSRLRRGDLSEDEEDRLAQGVRHVYSLSEYMGIDETPGLSLMELRSRCRRYHRETGVDLIVIDYLQLMSSSAKSESREREISEISMGLKALAKELQVPVIALAQLNRGPDSRPDKRPKISDLRESGSMEQDADMILFIYRDEYYNPTSEDQGVAEILIAKNRHGSTTTVKLAYQANFVSFQNLYKGPVDPTF
jgi:replicative DNA helicase